MAVMGAHITVSPREAHRILDAYLIDEAGCWIWQRAKNGNGYGQVFLGGHRYRAHRAAYEFFVGPIPTGLEIDHLCRVRACINPAHLEAVTRAENMRRFNWANPRRDMDKRRRVASLRADGQSMTSIAKMLGISRQRTYQLLRDLEDTGKRKQREAIA